MRIPRSASIEQSSVSATTTPESWTDFFTGIRRAELYPRTREALAPPTSYNLAFSLTGSAILAGGVAVFLLGDVVLRAELGIGQWRIRSATAALAVASLPL